NRGFARPYLACATDHADDGGAPATAPRGPSERSGSRVGDAGRTANPLRSDFITLAAASQLMPSSLTSQVVAPAVACPHRDSEGASRWILSRIRSSLLLVPAGAIRVGGRFALLKQPGLCSPIATCRTTGTQRPRASAGAGAERSHSASRCQ